MIKPINQNVLEMETDLSVRFSEVDSLGIVWHGNYVIYFEDGRERFGERFGLSYADTRKHGYIVPITHIEINYKNYIKHGDKLILYTKYHISKKAEINFSYILKNAKTGKIMATGRTTQVFIKADNYKLVFSKPQFFIEIEERFKQKNELK